MGLERQEESELRERHNMGRMRQIKKSLRRQRACIFNADLWQLFNNGGGESNKFLSRKGGERERERERERDPS